MLRKLLIKNYALIDSLTIEFDDSLNIITGETGAGKSIIMGALGLIQGNRAEGKPFFDRQRKCVVEAEFSIANYQLQELFAHLDLDYEEVSIIRRELTPEGKSRAFVNDTPVTLQSLRRLAEQLIDVHSQHATLKINEATFQLFIIDTLAQNDRLLTEYSTAYTRYGSAKKELVGFEESLQRAQSEHDYQKFVLEELEGADLQPEEQEQLEREQTQLEHAEEIKRYLHAAEELFESGEFGLLDGLKQAVSNLQLASKYLPTVESLGERCESALIELKDVAGEVARASESVLMDQGRLTTIQERLSLIYGLQSKHRLNSIDQLISLRDELNEKLFSSQTLEQKIEEKRAEIAALHETLSQLALELRERRLAVIPEFEGELVSILKEVGMPYARVEVLLRPASNLGLLGQDDISFMFTANKGQETRAIEKSASGGELSRVMLAIKSIVARKSALPTIVFDEIDTGISGEVALRVGQLLDSMSENIQVMSITHLPQIASRGHAHYKVYKTEQAGRTHSRINRLDEEERVLEVAEMLSGAHPSHTAIEHARKMLTA